MNPDDTDATFPGPPTPTPERDEILARKLAVLYANIPGALAVNLVVAAVVAMMLYDPHSRWFLTFWLVASFSLCAFRAGDVLYRRKKRPTPANLRPAAIRFHVLSGVQGVLWGTITYVLIPQVSSVQQLFLILVVSGMVGGGVSYLAALPTVYFCYLIPTLLPGCVRLLQDVDVVHRSTGMLGLVYALAMVFSALRTGRWIDNSVRTTMGNEALLADQEKTHTQLLTYRDHLETKVAERTNELIDVNTRLLQEIEQKEARRREAEQIQIRFRELTEMLPEIVFELDDEGALTYVNRKFYELMGYPPELPQGFPHTTELVSAEDASRFQEMFTRLLHGADCPPGEFEARRADGSTFPMMVVGTPIERDGEVHGVRGLVIDMTQQKELAARVRDTAKMEALGTLAGGVAHDFNNILAVVLAQAEIGMRRLGGTVGAEEILGRIVTATEQARKLVNQILTFARRDGEAPVPVDLASEVSAALVLVGSSLPADIALRKDIDGGRMTILGSPTQIQQVVLNLCANSVHAMTPQGGTLSLSLGVGSNNSDTTAHDPPRSTRYAELRVTDTGHGIPETVQARIFEPFFTTKGVGEGTGMGLSVVHGIVTGMDGTIQVDTRRGEETTFRVYLPLMESPSCIEEAPTVGLGVHGTEKVLVVDDEAVVCEAVADGLEMFGYQTFRALGPAEALEVIAKERPTVVVTDYGMPIMSGTELAHRVRQGGGADLPQFIIYTGNKNSIPRGFLRNREVAAVLQKPVRPEELARTVRQVLSAPQLETVPDKKG